MANTNDLAHLNGKLAVALRDPAYATWSTGEMDDLLTWATADLWPHVSRPMDPVDNAFDLVPGTDYYDMPDDMMAVSRLDLVDDDDNNRGVIDGRAWEVTGDVYAGTAQLHISPQIANLDGQVYPHGYGRYDLVTYLPPNDFVPLVIAMARAEGYRRVLSDRSRFVDWLARNQKQDVSMNEMIQMVNEADNEIVRLRRQLRTWQRPVPGLQG